MHKASVLSLMMGLACGGEKPTATKPPQTQPPQALEISTARALVVVDAKLQRLAPSGTTEIIAELPGAAACDVDDEHHVVWLASDKTLSAYDLVDHKVRTIVTGIEPGDDHVWQVQYLDEPSPYAQATAGSADGLNDCVALGITIGEAPKAGGIIVAEGDREWYCFEDGELPSEDATPPLQEEAAADKAVYDKVTLADPAYLVSLYQRRKQKGPRSHPEPKAPSAPTIVVDQSRCDETPEDCGSARYVGGERLWVVITDNSRGDFYHETEQLYDSETATFWNPTSGARNKHAPLDSGESLPLHPSPDGTWGLYEGAIVVFEEAVIVGQFEGSLCGWE